MIKKYDIFIYEKLNLISDIKNLAGKFLISDDQNTKNVTLLINQLNNSKDINGMKVVFLTYLIKYSENLKKLVTDTDDIDEIKTIVKDNLSSLYMALKSTIDFINGGKEKGDDSLKISDIFKESKENIKKLFQDDIKIFNRYVGGFTDLFIDGLVKSFNVETDNTQMSKIIKDTDEILQTQTDDTQEKEIDENLLKLKNTILNWFNNDIYKLLNNQFKK